MPSTYPPGRAACKALPQVSQRHGAPVPFALDHLVGDACTRAWLGDLTKAPVCRSGRPTGCAGCHLNCTGDSVSAVRMSRPLSSIAPGWWDYTTLDRDLLDDAARLRPEDLLTLGAARVPRRCSTTRSRTSTWPRRWNTSTPGGRRRPTIRPASAGRSGRRNNCRSSRGWSTRSISTLRHCALLGHGRMGRSTAEKCRRRIRSASNAPTGTVLQPHPARAADAGRQSALSQGRRRRYRESYDAGALRGDARRAGRSEALGVQRSAAARGQVQGRAAAAGRISQARQRAWSICTR